MTTSGRRSALWIVDNLDSVTLLLVQSRRPCDSVCGRNIVLGFQYVYRKGLSSTMAVHENRGSNTSLHFAKLYSASKKGRNVNDVRPPNMRWWIHRKEYPKGNDTEIS